MTDLLGGQEVWSEHAQAVSSILRALGLTDDVARQILSTDAVRAKVADLIIASWPYARSKPGIVLSPEVRSLIPDWLNPNTIVHVPATDFPVEKMKFIPFLISGEESVSSGIMLDRAVTLQCDLVGLADAPRILTYLNKTKPKDLEDCVLILPGTVLRDSVGWEHVPCLSCEDDYWSLDFESLHDDWCDYARLVSCK